jgi:response regulator RpfG family c-di-GMP phosphodiesterase
MPGMELKKEMLVVDDEPNVLKCVTRLFRKDDIVCHTAQSGQEGEQIFRRNSIGVVLSDQRMPRMDGITFLEKIQTLNPDAVRLLLTGYSCRDSAIEAVNRSGVFMYLTKPWQDDELRSAVSRAFAHYRLKMENRRLMELTRSQNDSLRSMNFRLEEMVAERTSELHTAVRTGVLMLSHAAEAKDDVTGNHINRIADLTEKVCLAMGMDDQKAKEIGFFSSMHDVGKIHVPDAIIKKNGRLTEEEFRIVKEHTIAGERIIGDSKFYAIARQVARHHHERWDGSGYPDGLEKEEIPLPARIVSVVDVYDALTHERPYKEAWSREKAIGEIISLSGKSFDPAVVEAFLTVVDHSGTNEKRQGYG